MSKKQPETTKVRVLGDCAFGLCGEVADIPTDLVAAAKARALVDDDSAAVAYAEEQLAAAAAAKVQR